MFIVTYGFKLFEYNLGIHAYLATHRFQPYVPINKVEFSLDISPYDKIWM